MAQLVGQMCVICRERIGNEIDSRFCSACGCPVHTACTSVAALQKTEGACRVCGAPATDVAPRRELAEQESEWQAGGKRRRRGGCIMAASVVFGLLGLMQFALANMRTLPTTDRHEARGNVFNGLVPVALGCAGFLLGLRQMSKKS
ncbi:unnamed protein product [Gemmata massiliana]|uniref:Uncharacterized protein n=1 Tax=Gemmata massiliana TaxID=1210884 RepID=A0A6P2CZI5_9BACT|nr:unnamed protein product [Gemmata massiliana]